MNRMKGWKPGKTNTYDESSPASKRWSVSLTRFGLTGPIWPAARRRSRCWSVAGSTRTGSVLQPLSKPSEPWEPANGWTPLRTDEHPFPQGDTARHGRRDQPLGSGGANRGELILGRCRPCPGRHRPWKAAKWRKPGATDAKPFLLLSARFGFSQARFRHSRASLKSKGSLVRAQQRPQIRFRS
jgi:hypothetical protein